MSAVLWNSAKLVDLMEDDLDVMEVILLDDTMAILYVGQHSAREGLMEEDTQACVNHFSLDVKWRGVAVEQDFKALTLAKGREMIRVHETHGQKTLRGWRRPRVTKLPAPLTERMPVGIDTSPHHFWKGARSEKWTNCQCHC